MTPEQYKQFMQALAYDQIDVTYEFLNHVRSVPETERDEICLLELIRYDNERAKIRTDEEAAEAIREYWNWVAQEWNTKDDTACP